MTKKTVKNSSGKKAIFQIILRKVIGEKNFRSKIVNFLGKFIKKVIGWSWEFGVPGNVILQKSPASENGRTICVPDSLDLDRCLSILSWLSACE